MGPILRPLGPVLSYGMGPNFKPRGSILIDDLGPVLRPLVPILINGPGWILRTLGSNGLGSILRHMESMLIDGLVSMLYTGMR